MRGIVLAWAVGLGLLTWRTAQTYHRPPVPGRVLGASAVFALLALLAEYEPAARAATLAAWAFDLAVLLQIPPASLTSTAGLGEQQSVNRPTQPRSEQSTRRQSTTTGG